MPAEESTSSPSSSRRAIAIIGLGQVLFAVTMISLGVMGLLQGNFAPIWTGVPKGLPGRELLAYVSALISLGSGIGLLWHRTAAQAARLLLISLLAWLVLFRLPLVFTAPLTTVSWWASGQTAAMVAASWLLHVRFARGQLGRRSTGGKGVLIARSLFGLALIPFGIAHFTFLQRTVGMVPSWLPWHLAWAYFTGCSLIAAGLAILLGVWSRLAAFLTAVELASFTFLVWGPVVVTGPNASQWTEIVVSCALTAAAFVVADSYRGRRWLGVGWR